MHNITVIFTRHYKVGKCNSIELLKIVEKIRPEIIFEELSGQVYSEIYNERSRTTLESNTIKMYLKDHFKKHIPVDTFYRSRTYEEDCDHMLNSVITQATKESFQYRNKLGNLQSLIKHHGFNFLNSDLNDKIMEELDSLKQHILTAINDEKLFKINKLHKEVVDKRENEILDNIYNFSEIHTYKQAILFIGSAHRKGFIKKIEERRKQQNIKINWSFFDDLI